MFKVDFSKKDSETNSDYIFRMCHNKDLGIYVLTWQEVADIINSELGLENSESAYRKPYQSAKAFMSNVSIFDNNGEKLMQELELKHKELFAQKVKYQDVLREYRRHLRDEARIDNLKEYIKECAMIVANKRPIEIKEIPEKGNNDKIAVVQIGDFHYGMFVINFLNEYDKDIYNKRIEKMIGDTIKYAKKMDVSKIILLNHGDMINGNIRASTRVQNELDVIEQTQGVAESLAVFIELLAENFNEVEYHSVTDNHARLSKKKDEHIEKENFVKFMDWWLETRLKDVKNVKISTNKINGVRDYDIGRFKIFDEVAFFQHGHKGKMRTIVEDLTLMLREFPIAIFTSHYHRNYEDEVHGIDLIMNPSGIGADDYAKDIRKSSKPRQKMTIFENDKENGVSRLATFFIDLE